MNYSNAIQKLDEAMAYLDGIDKARELVDLINIVLKSDIDEKSCNTIIKALVGELEPTIEHNSRHWIALHEMKDELKKEEQETPVLPGEATIDTEATEDDIPV